MRCSITTRTILKSRFVCFSSAAGLSSAGLFLRLFDNHPTGAYPWNPVSCCNGVPSGYSIASSSAIFLSCFLPSTVFDKNNICLVSTSPIIKFFSTWVFFYRCNTIFVLPHRQVFLSFFLLHLAPTLPIQLDFSTSPQNLPPSVQARPRESLTPFSILVTERESGHWFLVDSNQSGKPW